MSDDLEKKRAVLKDIFKDLNIKLAMHGKQISSSDFRGFEKRISRMTDEQAKTIFADLQEFPAGCQVIGPILAFSPQEVVRG